ncbi:MAG TPA: UDP-N-acetylmuramoyl-tripeptide--D-alanyl-D-alanine ligase [Acidimicrobiia bacterium]|nr:UDP-N-acetylmuramoyl-tripeptide--D-alanyl-D-alanine ligase [Acidimicrobiia bacterium]
MIWWLFAACVLATIPAGLRWLRVAQREHYLPSAVATFAGRWWTSGPANLSLLGLMLIGLVGSWWSIWWAFLVPAAQVGPVGLSIKGRSSPLAWTARLRRVSVLAGILASAVFGYGAAIGSAFFLAIGVFLLPALVDLALLAMGPVEQMLGNRWVDQAAARLKTSGAKVVAITGSYGKTTTKQYVAHLLAGRFRVVASPASFNNRMGLARAINEHLLPGTEVFVAEMGTYGPGEIDQLTRWIRPDVAAMVAIGPVHLERFRDEERIVTAKAEILDRAGVGVISVDHPLLSRLAADRAERMEVITVSGEGSAARVSVGYGVVRVDGTEVGEVPSDVFGVNLATAIGVGLALGVGPSEMTSRLGGLPRPEHRQTVSISQRGFTVIDDTFNSNPAGARAALGLLERSVDGGRKVVVTPGMVELGPRQHQENVSFAADSSIRADDLVIVGRTNRGALLEGSGKGPASVTVVSSRQEAVDWVRDHLGPGDAVLYENDLPDHYP